MTSLPDIKPFRKRFEDIDAQMATPDFYQDARRAVDVTREHQHLSKLLALRSELEKKNQQIKENQSIVDDPESDLEIKEMAEDEISVLRQQAEALHNDVLVSMLPPDKSDSRNTIVEIRAGAGGNEASLFAADLYRMYIRYAEKHGWKVEQLGTSTSEAGGFKEVVFNLRGDEVYKYLKFESGVHRVQRIPVTETNGRIHTSTSTVAVLPEAEEVDVHLDPAELEFSVCRASGPGGQGVNTTDSAVQILHKPTGLIVSCADERSQLKNKQKGLKVLRARLLHKKEEEERARYAQDRRSQIGSGDRSERIRTYNFPQSRLTDHRIGLTLYNLSDIMEGNLDEVIHALQETDHKLKIDELLSPDNN